MGVIGIISFINMLLRPNYFEANERMLIINKDFFRTQTVNIDFIERIDVGVGPFKFSKIILKDKTTVRYVDGYVDTKELREFMQQFNVPVE